jgi:hypothetical protein
MLMPAKPTKGRDEILPPRRWEIGASIDRLNQIREGLYRVS